MAPLIVAVLAAVLGAAAAAPMQRSPKAEPENGTASARRLQDTDCYAQCNTGPSLAAGLINLGEPGPAHLACYAQCYTQCNPAIDRTHNQEAFVQGALAPTCPVCSSASGTCGCTDPQASNYDASAVRSAKTCTFVTVTATGTVASTLAVSTHSVVQGATFAGLSLAIQTAACAWDVDPRVIPISGTAPVTLCSNSTCPCIGTTGACCNPLDPDGQGSNVPAEQLVISVWDSTFTGESAVRAAADCFATALPGPAG